MDELTIIIPTLNEEYYITWLLNSIAAQQKPPKLQVIVVDGKSSDKTKIKVQEFRSSFDELLFVTSEADVGQQRNIGVQHAKYEYLLFLDADVILPLDCLKKLSAVIKGKENFIATVLHFTEKMTFKDVAGLVVVYSLFFLSWLARTPVINGDFILTTKNVHRKINGFKEGAILGEDTDYGLRAFKSGAKYRFIIKTHIVGSDRRAKLTGRVRLIVTYSKVFIKVRKSGPTYDGIEFPFGHYQCSHRPVKAAIFDFDGTIADSFTTFAQIGASVFKRSVLTDSELEEVRGLSARQVVKLLNVKYWQLPKLGMKFRSQLSERLQTIEFFDGMSALIRKLHAEGVSVYILSTNSPANIRSLLNKNNLTNEVNGIYGNVGLFSKPKIIRRLLKNEKLSREQSVYIGDEVRDVEAAKKVNIPCIAVSWGFNSADLLEKSRPDIIVKNVFELGDYFENKK